MIRQTSIDAYKKIKADGTLSKRRLEALEAVVFTGGNKTHNELQKWLCDTYPTLYPPNYRNNMVARLGELRDRGVIRETGERECTLSGIRCITWESTDEQPLEIPAEVEEKTADEIWLCDKCMKWGRKHDYPCCLLPKLKAVMK